MKIQNQCANVRRRRGKKCARIFFSRFFTIIAVLAISAGSALAFEAADPATVMEKPGDLPLVSEKLPPSMADSCLPLLKSVRHTSPVSAMDRTQRSAGKAAALGVVFGVRFALGPKEIATSNRNKGRFDIWQTSGGSAGDRHALAVADYRACQKEKALEALSGFRWKR